MATRERITEVFKDVLTSRVCSEMWLPPEAITGAMEKKYPNETFKNLSVTKALGAFVPDQDRRTFDYDGTEYIIIRHRFTVTKEAPNGSRLCPFYWVQSNSRREQPKTVLSSEQWQDFYDDSIKKHVCNKQKREEERENFNQQTDQRVTASIEVVDEGQSKSTGASEEINTAKELEKMMQDAWQSKFPAIPFPQHLIVPAPGDEASENTT